MSRAHVEIHHLVGRLGRVLEATDHLSPDPADLRELQQLLYGLHAVLVLHFRQEEESYFALADPQLAREHLGAAQAP